MVPTTRNLHHDPQYFLIEGASAAMRGGLKKSRFPRLAMADDDADRRRRHQGDEAAGTSSQGGGGDEDKDWLQLGLATASSFTTSSSGDNDSAALAPAIPLELDLFAGKQSTRMVRSSLSPMPLKSYQYDHGRYRPPTTSGSSMSAPFLPFALPLRSSGNLMMRVISPPRRTEAIGLWLTLQAAPNQVKEPILPQIQKSYLRIKDNTMKVEVVMKYLADKLGLAQPHKVELTCRGQLLPPFLLVKYARDSIWCSLAPREEEAFVEQLPPRRSPPAEATDHVMILFYNTSRDH